MVQFQSWPAATIRSPVDFGGIDSDEADEALPGPQWSVFETKSYFSFFEEYQDEDVLAEPPKSTNTSPEKGEKGVVPPPPPPPPPPMRRGLIPTSVSAPPPATVVPAAVVPPPIGAGPHAPGTPSGSVPPPPPPAPPRSISPEDTRRQRLAPLTAVSTIAMHRAQVQRDYVAGPRPTHPPGTHTAPENSAAAMRTMSEVLNANATPSTQPRGGGAIVGGTGCNSNSNNNNNNNNIYNNSHNSYNNNYNNSSYNSNINNISSSNIVGGVAAEAVVTAPPTVPTKRRVLKNQKIDKPSVTESSPISAPAGESHASFGATPAAPSSAPPAPVSETMVATAEWGPASSPFAASSEASPQFDPRTEQRRERTTSEAAREGLPMCAMPSASMSSLPSNHYEAHSHNEFQSEGGRSGEVSSMTHASSEPKRRMRLFNKKLTSQTLDSNEGEVQPTYSRGEASASPAGLDVSPQQ